MEDRTALLEQLRIPREADNATASPSRRPWVFALGAAIGVGAAIGTWLFLPRASANESPTTPTPVAAEQEVRLASAAPAAEVTAGSSMLDASGYVVARRSATVASKTIGRVLEVAIEEGQQVEKGQIIARLDDSNTRAMLLQARAQLEQARANLHAAQVALDDARRIFGRNERQAQAGLISSQDFDHAKAAFNAVQSDHAIRERALEVAIAQCAVAERNQDDMTVRAPFAGIVTVKAAQPGEIVSPQSAGGGFTRTGIGTIVDMTSLEVEVDVSENFIYRVRPGQAAMVKLNAYPEWNIPAEVVAIIPTADRSKATVKVRVAFKERDSRVLPDMGARVSFLQS